jgi:hypothetical protein
MSAPYRQIAGTMLLAIVPTVPEFTAPAFADELQLH